MCLPAPSPLRIRARRPRTYISLETLIALSNRADRGSKPAEEKRRNRLRAEFKYTRPRYPRAKRRAVVSREKKSDTDNREISFRARTILLDDFTSRRDAPADYWPSSSIETCPSVPSTYILPLIEGQPSSLRLITALLGSRRTPSSEPLNG